MVKVYGARGPLSDPPQLGVYLVVLAADAEAHEKAAVQAAVEAEREAAARRVLAVLDTHSYDHAVRPDDCECVACEDAWFVVAAARGDYTALRERGFHLANIVSETNFPEEQQ